MRIIISRGSYWVPPTLGRYSWETVRNHSRAVQSVSYSSGASASTVKPETQSTKYRGLNNYQYRDNGKKMETTVIYCGIKPLYRGIISNISISF